MVLESTYFGNGIVLILSVALLIFVILFFAFKLGDDHKYLKLFCFLFAIFLLTLIPKAAIDYSGDCVVYPQNVTMITNATWQYDYVSECHPNTNTTQSTLLKSVVYFSRFIMIYLIIFASWKIFEETKNFFKRFRV